MSIVGCVVHYKYGPAVGREAGRYHCLATTAKGEPCSNITHWFYRPANSNLCKVHIRQHERRKANP